MTVLEHVITIWLNFKNREYIDSFVIRISTNNLKYMESLIGKGARSED